MRTWLPVVLAIWLAVAGGDSGPGSPAASPAVSADQASQIAVKAFTDQYKDGQKVTGIRILAVEMGPSGQGGNVWRFNVVGTVTETAGAHYDAAAWIDADPSAGAARIVTQG